MLKKLYNIVTNLDIEALIWISALVYLVLINPYESRHINLCLFSLVGIENCPGCGLGRSISMVFYGDFVRSFEMHPLGIPVLLFILKRIYEIIKTNITKSNTIKMEALNG